MYLDMLSSLIDTLVDTIEGPGLVERCLVMREYSGRGVLFGCSKCRGNTTSFLLGFVYKLPVPSIVKV